MELTERLRAALDETERVAREAGGVAWVKSSTYPDQAGVEEAATGEVVVYDEGWPTTAQAEHIALHDPERELRIVAAHRKILDWLAETEDRALNNSYWPFEAEPVLTALAEAYGVEA